MRKCLTMYVKITDAFLDPSAGTEGIYSDTVHSLEMGSDWDDIGDI